MNNNIKTVSPS